ncbi:hypothetical protein ABK040_015216 [Willaertia magna]
MSEEESKEKIFKKRKKLLEHELTIDILFEIIKYFKDIKDYLNLAQLNKYFYKIMLLRSDNYLFDKFDEILYNYNKLYLSFDLESLPNYLLKLKKLTFMFPTEILLNLKTLLIYGNLKLNNDCLQNLQNLNTLHFINNDTLNYNCLNNLPNLSELKLKYCESKEKGNFFKNLPNLIKLTIIKTAMINDSDFIDLNNLIKLTLNGCKSVEGSCLQNLTKLQKLNIINCNNIKDDKIINLTKLNINHCNDFKGSCLQNLLKLKKLTFKNDFLITDYLKNLINLKYLNIKIYDNKLFDLNLLQNLTNIKTLRLHKNLNQLKTLYLDLEGNFFNLTNLQSLSLSFLDDIFYCEDLKNLQKLQLVCLEIDTTDSEQQLILNKLTILKIDHSKFYPNDNFTTLNNFRNLVKLSAIDTKIIDNDLINLKCLQSLNIRCCDNITGECFVNFNQLQKLDISYCKNINFNNLQYLKNSLKEFSAKETTITDKDLKCLEHLRFLDLTCCTLFSGEFLLTMKYLKKFNYLFEDTCYNS